MEGRLTVLILHGSWHTPTFFQPFIQELQHRSIDVLCPLLPTCDVAAVSENSHLDMHADARAIEKELKQLISAGERVLIMAHSYGSVPGIEAVDKELGIKERSAAGKVGGIIGFFGISAFILTPNTGIEDLFGGNPAPFVKVHADGSTSIENPEHFLFNDLEAEAQSLWASKLVRQPQKAQTDKVTRPAYGDIPTAYVFTTNDQAIPPFAQQAMVKAAKDAGVKIHEYTCNTGHSPYLSQPQQLAEIMLEFIATIHGS